MTNALMERTQEISTIVISKTNFIEIELELDSKTYKELMYCQRKMNVSIDEVIKKCIYVLREGIL